MALGWRFWSFGRWCEIIAAFYTLAYAFVALAWPPFWWAVALWVAVVVVVDVGARRLTKAERAAGAPGGATRE